MGEGAAGEGEGVGEGAAGVGEGDGAGAGATGDGEGEAPGLGEGEGGAAVAALVYRATYSTWAGPLLGGTSATASSRRGLPPDSQLADSRTLVLVPAAAACWHVTWAAAA